MNPEFSDWVDRVSQGDIEPLHLQLLELSHNNFIPLPPSFTKFTYNLSDAVQFLSPPEILDNPGALSCRSFLSPLNIYVDEFNSIVLDSLPGAQETYYSINSIKEDERYRDEHDERSFESTLPSRGLDEYLTTITENGVPPHQLHLKVGSLCSIMHNFSIHEALVKNTKIIVQKFSRHVIEVETIPSDSNENST